MASPSIGTSRRTLIGQYELTAAFLLIVAVNAATSNQLISNLVEEMLNETRYNSRTRPSADDGPLDIYININVNGISSISEVNMDYSMTLYLREIWTDPRLAYGHSYNKSITLNHNQYNRLWTPDLFIRNLKNGLFHDITVPNRMIRLSPDGRVLYSQRLTLTLACDMVLDKYPMDNQTCNIEFGSYGYTTDDLVFHWRTDATPVEMNPNIKLPEYIIKGVSNEVCTKKFSSTGSFPCLKAMFHFDRRLRSFILTTYLPSVLVVLLSWLSFWIDYESAPARISLGILTILTITTQSSGLLRSTPPGSFTRAIDVWMAICLVFVFSAFIEYSIVNTLARRQKARKLKSTTATALMMPVLAAAPGGAGQGQSSQSATNGWPDEPGNKAGDSAGQGSGICRNSWCSELMANDKALFVECISRGLFPLLFLFFNLIYWPMYLA